MWFFKFFLTHITLLLLLKASTNSMINHQVSSATEVDARISGRNETDRLALLAIKDRISEDPSHVTSSWNESVHFCWWLGVSCGRRHRRVTGLNLTSRGLRGVLSPSIGNLSFLRLIDLSNNSFAGKIPHELGRLFRLRDLDLGSNMFGGEIPVGLSNCSDLRVLQLSGNEISGEIAPELGFLSRLTQLHITDNYIKGTIPPHLGNISSLKGLSAASNQLEGDIPASIGQLKGLRTLHLGGNMISGSVPQSIYNLSYLRVLSLAENRIQGRLPSNVGLTLKRIERFIVWGNRLSGPIPISFSNSVHLSIFAIELNNFSGGVPAIFGNLSRLERLQTGLNRFLGSGKGNDLNFISSLSNCTSLQVLYLDYSNFGGSLPNSIGNLSTSLRALYMAENQLSGDIPLSIGNLVGLDSIALHYNQLTGTLPETIGKLHKLQEVGFGKNQLSGEIPFSIGNLSLLNQLWLEENNFSGTIPLSFGNFSRLESLTLHSNALSGSIPASVLALSSLSRYLRLSRNRLTGSLPWEVGSLKNLVELDVSQNDLSGNIPSSLRECVMLERLFMSNNRFEGAIPKALDSLKSIEEMDLSHNGLSGPIPKDFAKLVFLSKLNLSSNDLEGELPKSGVFGNTSQISILPGNVKLCGGIPELHLPACFAKDAEKRKFSLLEKIIVSIVCGVVVLSLLIIWLIKKGKPKPASGSEPSRNEPFMGIAYGDLLQATNGFSRENLIDTGSFGSVYRGVLEPDQTVVAVKVMNLERRGASRSFMAECELLRNARHRNLLKIVTACSSIDYQGNEFKALVYEFMPNGSLESWLHQRGPPLGEKAERKLTLSQRVGIVIDVASALDYLHNHTETPIVHSDLKPSNILLDQDMVARVGDFGLSRIISQDHHQLSSTVGLKGTFGYAAPEYGLGSAVSCSGDVYSFGITVLEIFTGKRPTDGNFDEGMNLNQFVKMAIAEGMLEKVVDLGLLTEGEAEISEPNGGGEERERGEQRRRGCLISMLRIAVKCSEETPRERFGISEALKEIHKVRNSLVEDETQKSMNSARAIGRMRHI